MRHRDARQRLTQKPGHARMLKRNLVTSLLLYESVRTTRSRAKAVQPVVDRLITIAKKKPSALAIRAINQVVTDKNASRKVIEVFKIRYADRSSGLTRMEPAGARQGDGAKLVDLTLLEGKDVPAAAPKEKKTKQKTPEKATKTTAKAAPKAAKKSSSPKVSKKK